MNREPSAGRSNFWRSRGRIALCAFLGVAGIDLIVAHRAHALESA
jgi:hypothetical protein